MNNKQKRTSKKVAVQTVEMTVYDVNNLPISVIKNIQKEFLDEYFKATACLHKYSGCSYDLQLEYLKDNIVGFKFNLRQPMNSFTASDSDEGIKKVAKKVLRKTSIDFSLIITFKHRKVDNKVYPRAA